MLTLIKLKLGIISPAFRSRGVHVQVGGHLTCFPYKTKHTGINQATECLQL